ncbi:MAG: 50S ribosomal protein L25 [Phycisphaerae bacterium]|nr:50S ribosomal protein L25 [Phycisphaerae bacterium]
MSDTVTFKAQVRQRAGSKIAARLRQDGQLPAVVYGHKKDPVSVTLAAHDFVEALHHGHRIFEMDINGSKETILVKDLQYDHLGKSVIHADLMRVNLSDRVKVQVAIELHGTAQGTHEGGIVEEVLSHVEIECKVSDIPEALVVNIKELSLGQSVHASRIELPPDCKLVTDPDAVVAVCHETKAVVSEVVLEGEAGIEGAEEVPTEPEVITEKKEEKSSE